MEKAHPTFVAGIGGSAGSLSALKVIFEAMPIDTGMAFIVATHLLPSVPSHLAKILSWHTELPIFDAESGTKVHANHIYVVPPNADLFVEQLTLQVVSPPSRVSRQVDCLLTSLADAKRNRAIGIVLSGYGSDGTEGCKHIKAKGGITIAQDMSAEVSSMPQRAQNSGCIDFVLPPHKIRAELLRLSTIEPFES